MELVRKQLNGYRILQSQVQQFEQQTDIIIPDVNPDAMTVLGIWGNAVVGERQLRRDWITAGGTVHFSLLYRPENGGAAVAVKGSLGFQEVLELKEATEDDLLLLHAEIMELRGIILNSRKVGVHCRIALHAWVYQRESLLLTEGVHAKPEEGIQVRTSHQPTRRFIAAFEKNLSISEDVRIGEASKPEQLLYAALQWQAEDIRTLNKKVMIRGAAQLRLVMLGEGDTLREAAYALPFSQIVESSDVRTDCSVEIQYVTSQQQLRLERREEGLFLLCSLGAKAMVEVYRELPITTVSDMYSTNYHTQVKLAPLPTVGCNPEVLYTKLQETVKIDTPVSKVLQWYCCGAVAEVIDDKLRSSFCLCILWEDEEGCKKQQHLTLREERDGAAYCAGACKVVIQKISAACQGEALMIELQAEYHLRQFAKECGSQVEICELDITNPRMRYAPGTLLLRSVGENESTWDLAQAYGTTEDAILSANHLLPNQAPEANQLVMIPFLRK